MKFRYLLIIPCCLLIIAIKISGSWGLADVERQKARTFIEQWENDFESFREEDWNKVVSYAKAAVDKDPGNPDLLFLMGNVYEWNAFHPENQYKNNQQRKLALEYYRKAVELRPQWPYTWSGIALLKFRMNEFDQEFYLALRNAMELGPWEPRVQSIIAEVGLNVWDKLKHTERLPIVENIRRGVVMQPQVMLDILNKYGQLRMVCHEKNKQSIVEKYCEKNFGS